MNYLLSLLLLAVLSVNECCQHKTKQDTVTESKPDTITTKTDTVPQNKPDTVTETKPGNKGDIPACVQKQIDEAAKQSRAEAPVQIDEYLYKGKKVYLFTAPCCDQYNTIYDVNCKAICSPSGGFTGRGDGNCKDFDSTAKHIRLIWKNPSK